MKKALVMTFVLVLGLGFAAFADGVLSGEWDTDISLYPAASVFSDFIKSFTSEVDVDYTIGGFTFGMDSTFGVAGMTGMEFDVDGMLGAFTLSAEIDFSPRILATTKTEYTYDVSGTDTVGFEIQTTSCAGIPTFQGVSWDKKTVTNTYIAGFDDLKLESSVSIAGVSLDALFFLEGVDNVGTKTVSGYHGTVQTASWVAGNTITLTQSGSATVASGTNQGSGWRLTASGSFGGATITGRAYFNLEDDFGSYAGYLGYYSLDFALADYFAESGSWAIVCDDCIARFTGLQVLVEDVSFACTTFSGMVTFDCCGFGDVVFLVEDIGLGCCWDVNFDLMITFTSTSKTLTLDPEITLANACFTISAGLVVTDTVGGAPFTLDGIEIYGLGLEYSWNGITFTAATSWDLTVNPILGPAYLGGAISGPTKIYVLQPDTDFTSLVATYNEVNDTCALVSKAPAINMTTGLGYWEVTSFACEKAYAWEKFGVDVDGDSCCGGDFDISAVFYLGDIKELTDLDGTYYYDANGDGTYATTSGEAYTFYGAIDLTDVPSVTPFSGAGCNCCPCDDCTFEIDEVEWDADYTLKSDSDRLFDWIEADVDVVIGVGSAFDITFGLDVTCWGWEDFTFGFVFTF